MVRIGRILREAMRARALGPEWLAELNRFFAERRAYPLSVLAALSETDENVEERMTDLIRRELGIGESP